MESKVRNHGRKLLFSELFKGGEAEERLLPCKVPPATVSDAGSISSDIWSTGSSFSATTPCSVLGSELSSISTTDSEDDEGDTDLIAELNRQMADYVLQDDDDNEILLANHEEKRKNEEEGEEERKDKLTDWRNEDDEDEEANQSQRRRTLLQQRILQNGSAMTRGSAPNNASFGTGVFLPRGIITPRPPFHHRTRKKTGCSTILIPTRVLQVLQQHHLANSNIIPEIIRTNGLRTRRHPFPTGIGNSMPTSNEVTLQQKQRHHQQQQHGEQHLDVSDLPKEWIY